MFENYTIGGINLTEFFGSTQAADSFLWGSLAGAIMGAVFAFFILFLLIFLAVYIYTSLTLMLIAKKTGAENTWLAWIPFVNLFLVIKTAKASVWWILLLTFYAVPVLGFLVIYFAKIPMFWKIAKRLDYPGWTSLLLLIPGINLIVLGIYAWGN